MELTPAFKMSEAGPIPKDWEAVRFESVAAKTRNAIVGGPFGSDLTSNDYQVTGVPVIRGSNMHGRHVHGPFVYVGSAKAKTLEANLARRGDVVFTQRGTLGQVALVPNNGYDAYLISQSQMKASLDPEACAGEFIVQVFEQPEYQRKIVASAIQTGVPHLNLGILRGYVVPQPPLREQRAIAEVLGDVDSWIEAAEAGAAKLAAVKAAAMDALLTATIRLPGFNGGWVRQSLGDLATTRMGRTPARKVAAFWGSGHKWVAISDLTGPMIMETAEEITDLAASSMSIVPRGTLLMSFKLSLGRVAVAGVDLFTNEAICALTELKVDQDYLRYVLPTLDFAMFGVQAAKGYTLNKESLAAIELNLPVDHAEQRAIADVLVDIDTAIAASHAVVVKAKGLKAAAMDALLSGRTRVPLP